MNLTPAVVEFLKQFAALEPGQSFVYYRGHMGSNRTQLGALDARDLGEAALRLATPRGHPVRPLWENSHDTGREIGLGTADLTQRKIAEFCYEYIITMRKNVCKGFAADRIDEKAKETGVTRGGDARRRLA